MGKPVLGDLVELVVHLKRAYHSTVVELIQKLSGPDGLVWLAELKKFLRKEPAWANASAWYEKDGVVYLHFVSDGRRKRPLLRQIFKKGFKVSGTAQEFLSSDEFVPTEKVWYRVAIMKSSLFPGNKLQSSCILAEAKRRGLSLVHPEIAYLILKHFTKSDLHMMGLEEIVMVHRQFDVEDENGKHLAVLVVNGNGIYTNWFYSQNHHFDTCYAFAFIEAVRVHDELV